MPSQGHLFNFDSAKCKNRTSCRRVEAWQLQWEGPHGTKTTGSARSLAFSLCQRLKGKPTELRAACCLHESPALSPLSPFLVLSLCICLLLHLFPVSSHFAFSLLPRSPLLRHFYVPFISFSPSQGQALLPCSSTPTWAALAFPGSLSPGSLGDRIALSPLSHLCPLHLPRVPDTENVLKDGISEIN